MAGPLFSSGALVTLVTSEQDAFDPGLITLEGFLLVEARLGVLNPVRARAGELSASALFLDLKNLLGVAVSPST